MLLAAKATIVCRSQSGERLINARDFFLDTFTDGHRADRGPDRDPHPRRPRRPGGAYAKLERKVGDFATVGVAAVVATGEDGTITSAGIGVTGVSDTPFAATDAEAILTGRPVGRAFPSRRRRGRPPRAARRPTSAARSTTSGPWPPR